MMYKTSKIKAGALQLAMMISIVIALLLTAFILLVYTQNRFSKDIETLTRLVNVSRDGIFYFQQIGEFPYNINKEIQLDNNEGEILGLERSHWGIYDVVRSKAQVENKSHQKIALIGASINDDKRPVLYLQDDERPLVVVGNTRINGRSYIPTQGIKAGNISGNYYTGSQLLYGEQLLSDSKLPSIEKDKRGYLFSLLEGSTIISDSLLIALETHTLKNSHRNKTKWVYQKSEIILNDQKFEGNIIIKSDTRIVVTRNVTLDNIILIAPVVEINSHFKGRLQVIVNERVIIKENCLLEYPSSIVYLEQKETASIKEQSEKSGVEIMQGTEVRGSILSFANEENTKKTAKICLQPQSLVIGEVYSETLIELRGEIIGSTYAKGFVSKEKGSVYMNHLFNVNLSSYQLPDDYSGIPIEGLNKTVVEWID